MHIHILGICGTFMGSLAVIAKQLGYRVSGSDANVYPPMSTQLQELGIDLQEGFRPEYLQPPPDLVIIGNALSRGNPAVEHALNEGLNFTSGPQWLAQYVLHDKWVLGVAGTHGKTSTSAMLAWILEYAGVNPGYLIGGVTNNFKQSASLGDSSFFVVEADEYDSAFFDKRSKFVHYVPRTLILNNLEFDHADIFNNIEEIERQFHHLVRTVPGNGLILFPHGESAIEGVLRKGCWSSRQQFGISVPTEVCKKLAANGGVFWNALMQDEQGSEFELTKYGQGTTGEVMNRAAVSWEMTGIHNVRNAIAAVAAAHHVGIEVATAREALLEFKGVKRRMELRGTVEGVKVYDDFAHHPTAIELTLQGIAAKLRADGGDSRLIAVIEPRSNTMKSGVHQHEFNIACQAADMVIWFKPEDAKINFSTLLAESIVPAYVFSDVDQIVTFLEESSIPGDHIVIMSNGGFGGIHDKLLQALQHGPSLLN
ncbi:MAG: UDP-N-acetylmuramate:L-alanyl-gamma-D-glutamyl-meso-diaminopimelate ligase [Gammaproteobacteria bacterium]|jgi:UDP-N-acetylmuramate: L-alanyl-gamma-D-glutamyl-meso-diaminopimelate ligase|nr:UDP-N-acetylmuramate:L-alanyl-gamma-D-glutamyl-meso-diaminopimelate ligase [Gammaproteobacteria bacterium]MDP6731908.1 UDP-N-acetylmuramate:L-alanyl-gamma-D-glutamyl-meso-diaminopimelate ligase [Gammaproteobacteria bacterium]